MSDPTREPPSSPEQTQFHEEESLGHESTLPQQPQLPQPIADATRTFGSSTPSVTLPDNTSPPPGYRVLGELGRGGMGVVYHAVQVGLNRPVALKMVLTRGRGDTREFVRFLTEAEAVASVRHPHVVQVYEYGDHEGQPFLAMEYLPKGSLSDLLKVHGRFAAKEAAQLLIKIARGVQAAHEQGIVHRDLKPGNVLIDEAGEPKVTDFGLAKRGQTQELTVTGAIMGTPAYMAPEQARGDTKFVGPGADVYALGVMLFELLTGRRPFEDADPVALIMKVANDSPPSLRSLRHEIPRDLELITLKCLAKTAAERYPSAKELADDLQRFVSGEPVTVRSASFFERTVKLAKRYPAISSLLMLLFVGGLFGVVSITVLYFRAEEQRKQVSEAAGKLIEQSQALQKARDDAVRDKGLADEARREAQRITAGLGLERGLSLMEQGEPSRGLLWMGRAIANAPPDDAELQRVLRTNLAAWESSAPKLDFAQNYPTFLPWDYSAIQRAEADARNAGRVDESAVVELSPNGRYVALSLPGRQMTLWDNQLRKLVGQPVAWLGPDFMRSRSQRANAERPYPAMFVFSPDNTRLVCPKSNNEAQLIDTATGEVLASLPGAAGLDRQYEFSDDSQTLLTVASDKPSQEWDARTGKRLADLPQLTQSDAYQVLRLNADNVVMIYHDRHVRSWKISPDQVTPVPVKVPPEITYRAFVVSNQVFFGMVNNPPNPQSKFQGPIALRWTHFGTGQSKLLPTEFTHEQSPSLVPVLGPWYFIGNAAKIQLWNGLKGEPAGPVQSGELIGVSGAVLSPDGKHLAAFFNYLRDKAPSLQIWSTETGTPVISPVQLKLREAGQQLRFAANGEVLIYLNPTGEMTLYSLAKRAALGPPITLPPSRSKWVESSEGWIYELTAEGIQKYNLRTGKVEGPRWASNPKASRLQLTANEKFLLVTAPANVLEVWERSTGKKLGEIPGGALFTQVGTGDYLMGFTSGKVRKLQIWELATAKLLSDGREFDDTASLPVLRGKDRLVSFAIGGETAKKFESRGVVTVQEFPSGKLLAEWPHHGLEPGDSPLGRVGGAMVYNTKATIAVTMPTANELAFWNLQTGQAIGSRTTLSSNYLYGTFNADGTRFIASTADAKAQVFDATTGKPVGPLHGPLRTSPALGSFGFEPAFGGRRWVIDLPPRRVQVLNPQDGQLLGSAISVQPSPSNNAGDDYQYSTDGRYLLAKTIASTVEAWDTETGKRVGELPPFGTPPTFATYLPGNRLMIGNAFLDATRTDNGRPLVHQIYDRKTGKAIHDFTRPGTNTPVFGERPILPDVQLSAKKTHLHYWKRPTREVFNLADPTGEIQPKSIPIEGSVYHILSSTDSVIYEIHDSARKMRLREALTGEPIGAEIPMGPGLDFMRVTFLSHDPQRTRLLVDYSQAQNNEKLRLYDVKTGQLLKSFRSTTVGFGVNVLSSGSFVAGGKNLLLRTDRLLLVSASTGDLVFDFGPGLSVQQVATDGQSAILGSEDGVVKIVSMLDGRLMAPVLRHQGGVQKVLWGPDANRLIVVSREGNRTIQFEENRRRENPQTDHLRIWRLTSQETNEPMLKSLPFIMAGFNATGSRVLLYRFDQESNLAIQPSQSSWDIRQKLPVVMQSGFSKNFKPAAISLDGKWTLQLAWFQQASREQTALLNTETGLATRLQANDTFSLARFSPKSDWLLLAGARQALNYKVANPTKPVSIRHDGVVLVADFSPDGKLVATGDDTGQVQVWELDTGKVVQQFRTAAMLLDLKFDATGQRLIAGTGQLKLGQLAPVGEVLVWSIPKNQLEYPAITQRGAVAVVRLSPNGQTVLFAGEEGTGYFLDLATGQVRKLQLKHGSPIWAAGFHPKDDLAFTAGDDGRIALWKASTGEKLPTQLKHDKRINVAEFSQCGRWLVSAGDDHLAKVWQVSDWTQAGESLPHHAPVESLSLSSDGNLLATSATAYGANSLWRIPLTETKPTAFQLTEPEFIRLKQYVMLEPPPSENRYLGLVATNPKTDNPKIPQPMIRQLAICDLRQGQLLGPTLNYAGIFAGQAAPPEAKLHRNDDAIPSAFAVSPNAKYVAIAANNKVQVFDAATAQPVAEPSEFGSQSSKGLAVSNEADLVAIGCVDGVVRLLNPRTREAIGPGCQMPRTIHAVLLSPDAKTLLAASASESTARLFEVSTGQPIGEPISHSGPIMSLAFAPNGEFVATGSLDQTVRLWDARTGKPLGRPLPHSGMVYSISVHPDNQYILTLEMDQRNNASGNVRLWPAPVPSSGTAAEIEAYLRNTLGMELDKTGAIRLQLDQQTPSGNKP